jgi:SAM-dependent methyltransferase
MPMQRSWLTPGVLLRKALGPYLPAFARGYRRIYLNPEKLAQVIAQQLPKNASVLDVGGGDGYLSNDLLALRKDISLTLIDLATGIGQGIDPSFRNRVYIFDGKSIQDWMKERMATDSLHAVVLSDVIHHIPDSTLGDFLRDLAELCRRTHAVLIIKDVEPGHYLATMGLWADKYLSGDRGTRLVSQERLVGLLKAEMPNSVCVESVLKKIDPPNYCVVFKPK